MEIVYREEELLHYMEHAVETSPDHPVLVDRYLTGKEIEVDAICDGENVLFRESWSISNALGSTQGTRLLSIHRKTITGFANGDNRRIYDKTWQKD